MGRWQSGCILALADRMQINWCCWTRRTRLINGKRFASNEQYNFATSHRFQLSSDYGNIVRRRVMSGRRRDTARPLAARFYPPLPTLSLPPPLLSLLINTPPLIVLLWKVSGNCATSNCHSFVPLFSCSPPFSRDWSLLNKPSFEKGPIKYRNGVLFSNRNCETGDGKLFDFRGYLGRKPSSDRLFEFRGLWFGCSAMKFLFPLHVSKDRFN